MNIMSIYLILRNALCNKTHKGNNTLGNTNTLHIYLPGKIKSLKHVSSRRDDQ